MEQEDNEFPTSEVKIEESEIPDDIDNLATTPPQKTKPYQENFIEEKSSKARIAESQESTRGWQLRSLVFMVRLYSLVL